MRGLMTLTLLTRDTMRVKACSSSCVRCDRLRRDTPAGIEMNELPMVCLATSRLPLRNGATVVRVGQAIYGARPLPGSHFSPAASA